MRQYAHALARLARTLGIGAGLALASVFAAHAADTFPSKPVRLIVPFPPGGGVDVMSRLVANDLSKHLGEQVVVDNRGGAGTIIGTELLARSAPDGYTMMMANVAFGANPALHDKLPYDSAKDFAAVSLVALLPSILVVNPALPVKTVKELVALAKKEPGKLSYASAGNGSYIHLSMELFKKLGELPHGRNYLSMKAKRLPVDTCYATVEDRSNANFLWFIKFERSFQEKELQMIQESVKLTAEIVDFAKWTMNSRRVRQPDALQG